MKKKMFHVILIIIKAFVYRSFKISLPKSIKSDNNFFLSYDISVFHETLQNRQTDLINFSTTEKVQSSISYRNKKSTQLSFNVR